MIWHSKHLSLLPPWGHIEKNESPEETARRKIFEEIGIIERHFIEANKNRNSFSDERIETLLTPHFLIKENIEEDHYYMDWIYFDIVPNLNYNSPEGHKIELFSPKDIESEENIFKNG